MLDFLKPRQGAGAAAPKSESESVRCRIAATKIRTAVAAMPRNVSAGQAGVLLGVLGMSHVGPGWQFQIGPALLAWAVATWSANFACIALALRFERSEHTDRAAVDAARQLVLVFGIAGACWGSASWLLLPARMLEQDAFLLAGMALVLMGGAGAQAVYRPVLLAFTLSMTLMFVTGLARLADPFHIMLAFGFLVYGLVALFYARSQELAMTTAIELALENETLLAERTAQERAARQAKVVAEEAREQAEKAREQAELAHRSKTNFIAATSHDLRQPMHALVQYVAHLRSSCADPLSAPTIARIEESVEAMEHLLEAVLDFSRISMGSIRPTIGVVAVDRLMHSIDTQIRPLASAKGLALRVQSCGGCFVSDPVLLERVIRNVAQNAVRYTNRGAVVIRAVPRADIVRVLIADSGIGVAACEKSRIFDEYYQADNSARDRRKGLGLGLAIVRDLARMLGLRIRLKSLPGHGCTFAIEVPRAAGDVLPVGPATDADAGQRDAEVDYVRGALVVLIDDDPLALDGLRTTLEDFGCRVLAARSGGEAVDALAAAEFPPQAVVSDYRLGRDENGLQAIARVLASQRELYGESFALPALLITGDTSPQELGRVVAAGYPLLHKPVGTRRLHAALNAALRDVAQAEGA